MGERLLHNHGRKWCGEVIRWLNSGYSWLVGIWVYWVLLLHRELCAADVFEYM